MGKLVIFGMGYSARRIADALGDGYSEVVGTHRSPGAAVAGYTARRFDGETPDPTLAADFEEAEALLVSIAPDATGDPVLRAFSEIIAEAPRLRWIGYLSTIGVYGDHGGDWVDEDATCRPVSARSKARLAAEAAWADLAERHGVPLAIFRLSGIYGPGRNAFVKLEAGTAKRIVKPEQVFNRIHVDDIAGAVEKAARRGASGIFNVTDDEPAPPQDVVAYAARLMGVSPPPEIAFEDAEMTPMARSFYGENKRVANAKARRDLGWSPLYPTYRSALETMWREGSWRGDD